MITYAELKKISAEKKIEVSQIEKDYLLGWILAGLFTDKTISKSWLFKGGTCLRKCFFEDYRYSEDLDFTICGQKTIDQESFHKSVERLAEWVLKETGIEIVPHRSIIEVLHNTSNQKIIQGRICYRGFSSPTSSKSWPKIKLDVTSDEVVVEPGEDRKIIHPYSDQVSINQYTVKTYSFYDLLAEKVRALFERARPRDLYDVVEIFKRTSSIDSTKFKKVLKEKCLYKNLHSLPLNSLKLEPCKAGWNDQLSHQLDSLPSFENYLKEFYDLYERLELNRI